MGQVIKLVEDLRGRVDLKRREAGGEGLKPLPRVDVCVWLEVGQGGPISMVFRYGVVDV